MNRDAVQRAISGLEDVVKRASERPTEIPQAPVWHGAQQVLMQNGGPMTAVQMANALLRRGWAIDGKAPSESVRTALIRKPEIFNRGTDGSFRLHVGVKNTRAVIE